MLLSLWIDIGIVLWTAVPAGGNSHLPEAPPVAMCPKSLTRQTQVHGIRLTMSVDKLHLASWLYCGLHRTTRSSFCVPSLGAVTLHFWVMAVALLCRFTIHFCVVPPRETEPLVQCMTHHAVWQNITFPLHDTRCIIGMAVHGSAADVMRRVRVGVMDSAFSNPSYLFSLISSL